ncbi:hypothetical protein [Paenibacillus oryzisoli]|nr:hypothetical protein [Paenibacillus oryzisoli]
MHSIVSVDPDGTGLAVETTVNIIDLPEKNDLDGKPTAKNGRTLIF